MQQQHNMMDAAFGYAERGWKVFPCKRRAKTPATAHGFKDGSTDPAKIAGWFANGQNNIGIATGNGFLVLDLDTKNGKDGIAELAKLEQLHGELPYSMTARTPSGGEHRLYKYPANLKIKSNSDQLAPGVDIRADGGYIVAAPSVLENGEYYWISESWLAELPQAWVDLLTSGNTKKKSTSPAPAGQRFDDRNEQLADLQDALMHIDANDYDTWTRVGLALFSLGNNGFVLWDTWSRNSDKYDSKGMQQKWQSFSTSTVAPATVFHIAQQNGWTNPKKRQQIRDIAPAIALNHEAEVEENQSTEDEAQDFMSAVEVALMISAKTTRTAFPFVHHKAVWWAKVSGKENDQPVTVERISNCLPECLYFQKDKISLEATYFVRTTRAGTKRVWQEAIFPSDTTSPDSFNNALRKLGGGLTWSGSKEQLVKFHQEYWFHTPDLPEVNSINYIGYVAEHKVYLFTNQAIKGGKVIEVNDQDYIDLDNGIRLKTSYRADTIKVGKVSDYKPELWFDDFRSAYGIKGIIALAYWTGTYFAEQIRQRHGRFPFLEMCGEPNTGKSSVITFLWKLSGRANYEGIDPTKASGPGKYKTFEQNANLPIVLMEGDRTDERGHQKGLANLSEYKGMYNGRGMRVTAKKSQGTETNEPPFRSALIFEQNVPIWTEDKAVMERIIQVLWDKTHHTTAGYHADKRLIALDMEQINSYITACISKESRFLETFEQGFEVAKKKLDAEESTLSLERVRFNCAVIMGLTHALKASGIIPGILPADLEAVDSVMTELCRKRHIQLAADSEIVSKFWDVVTYLENQTSSSVNHSKDPKRIAINLNWLDRAIKDQSQKDYGDTKTLQAEIRTSKRFKFVEYATVKSAINNKNIACYIFESPNGLGGEINRD